MPFVNSDGQVVRYSRKEKRSHLRAVARGEKVNENLQYTPAEQAAYAKGRLAGESIGRRSERKRSWRFRRRRRY